MRAAWMPALLALLPLAGAAAQPAGPEGIASFRIDRPLVAAARDAERIDPAAALIGPGCDGRDQVTIALPLAGRPMTLMAMASDGRIDEVVLQPPGRPDRLDAAACRAVRDELATLVPALRPAGGEQVETRPMSVEYRQPLAGRATAVARWFPAGGSCDVALVWR